MKFETYIFEEFYTIFDKLSDPNKDLNGKGTQERYTETWGSIIDGTLPYVDNIGRDVIEAPYRLDSLVPYGEKAQGYLEDWIWFFEEPMSFRKRLSAIMGKLYAIRSTIKAYEVMFAWLGMSVVITEDFVYLGGLDSPLLLDSPVRTLDSFANTWIDYEVALTGPVGAIPPFVTPPPDPAPSVMRLIHAIYTILIYNQAVNIRLKSITYNGIDINPYFSLFDTYLLNRTWTGGSMYFPYTGFPLTNMPIGHSTSSSMYFPYTGFPLDNMPIGH